MVWTILTLIALSGVSLGKDHNAHGGPVDPAIENVDWHYSDSLCLDLLLVDCAKHVTVHDEQICGSDGQTYANQNCDKGRCKEGVSVRRAVKGREHCTCQQCYLDQKAPYPIQLNCVFVHAVCEFSYAKQKLNVQNHGPCASPTPIVSTGGVVSSTAAASSAAPSGATVVITGMSTGMSNPASSTMAPPASSTSAPQATVSSTMMPVTSTVFMTTGSTMPTTTDQVHGIIANVFCQNAATINCNGSGVDIICATNGVFYPNQCEFAKAKCTIPTLEHNADQNACLAPGK